MSVLEGKFKEDLMIFDLEASTYDEVITKLSELLHNKGYVKDSFKQAVLDREKVFPTGLILGKYNIAIPHTEICHVNNGAIAVAKLKTPVVFKYMANPEEDVMVSLVFLMAINDAKGHVPVLSKLMEMMSQQDMVEKLMNTNSKQEFKNEIDNGGN